MILYRSFGTSGVHLICQTQHEVEANTIKIGDKGQITNVYMKNQPQLSGVRIPVQDNYYIYEIKVNSLIIKTTSIFLWKDDFSLNLSKIGYDDFDFINSLNDFDLSQFKLALYENYSSPNILQILKDKSNEMVLEKVMR